MAKEKTLFVCSECSYQSAKWLGRCHIQREQHEREYEKDGNKMEGFNRSSCAHEPP